MACRNPLLTPVQARESVKQYAPVPANCVVTGGTGFVGIRLCEMLVERGAKRVVAFDIVPKEKIKYHWDAPEIEYVVGDVTDPEALEKAIKGADCVWHIAAAVGPFHPHAIYKKVNYLGTLNVIAACRKNGVKKLVMSSSPSTRFRGSLWSAPNVDGLTEAEMPKLPLKKYMAAYAETKAMAEMAVTASNCPELLTVSVAPHQVYGPRDNLFMPNFLEAAGTGKLRIFGQGKNRICFTHVDNYCHGLILAEQKLYPESPVLGKFYIVTDGDTHPEKGAYCVFWKTMDEPIKAMGFTSLWSKFKLPFWFMYILGLLCDFVGWMVGKTFKLNLFNVFVLTMNRWFDISAAEKDLGYKPIIGFTEGLQDTTEWFKKNWLPEFKESQKANRGMLGIAKQSQAKINIQADSTLGGK